MFPQLSVCLQSIQTCNSTGSGCLRRRLDYLCFINKARKCKARSPENQLCVARNGGFFFGATVLPFALIYLFSLSIPPLLSVRAHPVTTLSQNSPKPCEPTVLPSARGESASLGSSALVAPCSQHCWVSLGWILLVFFHTSECILLGAEFVCN